EDLQAGDFFGEHSVLSMNAHLISVETATAAVLVLIPQFIVQELTATQDTFRSAIMQKYVERSLRVLIRRVPALRFAGDADFARLLALSEVKSFETGTVLFGEG